MLRYSKSASLSRMIRMADISNYYFIFSGSFFNNKKVQF
jgi:hypothetical protein